jgi:hypothetical protein
MFRLVVHTIGFATRITACGLDWLLLGMFTRREFLLMRLVPRDDSVFGLGGDGRVIEYSLSVLHCVK